MSRDPKAQSFDGQTLAKDYYIMGLLGVGSFGQVKMALHLMTKTLVAIKILQRGSSTNAMIASEIEILKTLHHAHIIELLQVIETRQKAYLVMEYAARGPLLKRVIKRGPLGEEEARPLFWEIALAVKYIHSHNIAHRDLKPDNILVDWEGHIKLSDFGLGKRLASGEKTKGFCGTREYCAPEVFSKEQYEVLPADIWSLGVVLFYLVTGTLPFKGKSRLMTRNKILSRDCCIPDYLSPELQDLLDRLMTLDATERPTITQVMEHPWLAHHADTLTAMKEISREPDNNLIFDMYMMGYKIKEIKETLSLQRYNSTMATYLIIKKSPWKGKLQQDEGQGETTVPENPPNRSLPPRRGTSAPTLPSFSFPCLHELPERRRHSVPPTLSSSKQPLLDKTSLEHINVCHQKRQNGREIESSSGSTTSSKASSVSTCVYSSYTNAEFEITESSEASEERTKTSSCEHTSNSTSSEETSFPSEEAPLTNEEAPCSSEEPPLPTKEAPSPSMEALYPKEEAAYPSEEPAFPSAGAPFPCKEALFPNCKEAHFPKEEAQDGSTGTESSPDTCPSPGESDPKKHYSGKCQDVPKVPPRRWGRKGLKKRIGKAVRNCCCCCVPARERQHMGRSRIMAANREGHRDTG